jgi:uncharacterized protein (TIGR03435 family)
MKRLQCFGVCVLALTVVLASAQDEHRFTVASVQPSADNNPGMVVPQMPPGRYSARKVPVIALLTSAYGLSPERIVGAPQWPDRYDIQARFEPTDPSEPIPRTNVLLQSLLRDRFGLVAHMAKRDFPVYVLKVARTDGRLGTSVKASAVNCGDSAAANSARERNLKAANGAPACGAIERPDAFIAGGMTMDVVASALRIPAGRPVINETGLVGTWEVSLEFAPLRDTRADKPNVFTALQEQLGLKLEPATAPLDVLVIDHIERPTPD